ncbi:pentapeptide repeat-containing protein [Micromonospora radicis]|uniref:Uncharacterized protein n=1 Tax=Micromonospora radicis TaxID=1894971 RepID=A0A418MX07_9ACTN|nr:hypothetical protein D2L64_11265 [Micromonospora radicis]
MITKAGTRAGSRPAYGGRPCRILGVALRRLAARCPALRLPALCRRRLPAPRRAVPGRVVPGRVVPGRVVPGRVVPGRVVRRVRPFGSGGVLRCRGPCRAVRRRARPCWRRGCPVPRCARSGRARRRGGGRRGGRASGGDTGGHRLGVGLLPPAERPGVVVVADALPRHRGGGCRLTGCRLTGCRLTGCRLTGCRAGGGVARCAPGGPLGERGDQDGAADADDRRVRGDQVGRDLLRVYRRQPRYGQEVGHRHQQRTGRTRGGGTDPAVCRTHASAGGKRADHQRRTEGEDRPGPVEVVPDPELVGAGTELPDAELGGGQSASGEYRVDDGDHREQPQPAGGGDDVGRGGPAAQRPERHQRPDQHTGRGVAGGHVPGGRGVRYHRGPSRYGDQQHGDQCAERGGQGQRDEPQAVTARPGSPARRRGGDRRHLGGRRRAGGGAAGRHGPGGVAGRHGPGGARRREIRCAGSGAPVV